MQNRPRSTATAIAGPASSTTSSKSASSSGTGSPTSRTLTREPRLPRLNPESTWIVKDVPELRIVDQELWEKAKARQRGLTKLRAFHQAQRPRMLLSYLLTCSCCGGGFSKVSQNHYGCSTARNKGTCDNRLTVRQDEVEGLVIGALQSRLMDSALCAEFCEEYTRQRNALRGAQNAQLASAKAELTKLAKDRDRLIEAIKAGVPGCEVKDELARIATRREELEALLATAKEEPVLLHPAMADHYRQQVAALAKALIAEENRGESADIRKRCPDPTFLCAA